MSIKTYIKKLIVVLYYREVKPGGKDYNPHIVSEKIFFIACFFIIFLFVIRTTDDVNIFYSELKKSSLLAHKKYIIIRFKPL